MCLVMNRSIYLILVLLLKYLQLSGQVSEYALPNSLSMDHLKATSSIPEYKMKSLDRSALLAEDRLNPYPFRYASFEDMNIDLRLSGKTDTLPLRKGKIWRLRIETDSASSIQIILRKFSIPPGAKLFVYNEQFTQILGAFTRRSMQTDSTLTIADIIGSSAVVEYNEPHHPAFPGEIIIGSVAQGYKDIYQPTDGSSYININCPEGKELQLAKHAVCRITFRSGSGSYLCTGALVNNVRQDAQPYFLTANHCISDSAEASTLVAYFNFENEGCSGNAITPHTLSGARLLTTAPESDYSLLLLNNVPSPEYQPYYAGWDASNTLADRVTGVHHPEGLTKKLSIENDSIDTNSNLIQWEGGSVSPARSHWQVQFDKGITAGGSSGSPLFNKSKQIIGQLHGVDEINDFYGKLSYSWTHTSGNYPKIKNFLDPDNTGKLQLDGYYPANIPPDAFFSVPFYKVCTHADLELTDYSAFAPYARKWIITPATYSYTRGTSQSSPRAVVEFHQPGIYSVKLIVTNAAGYDTMLINNAIQVGETIDVGINSSPSGESCLCNFDYFKAWATGATLYEWNIQPGSEDKITLDRNVGDTVIIRPGTNLRSDSALTVGIRVIGAQESCADTAYLEYNLLKPVNDDVEHALLLQYGESDTYSNKCATIEADEPVPPYYSCTAQYSWCDEYGNGENIVERSIWFKFVAGSAGHISISSSGFDNQVALYEAYNYLDILSGNFTILGANDDRSNTDFNPLIRSAEVTPGETYWLQVDGSGGGLEGSFQLQLTDLTITGISPEKEGLLHVYPQPASDYVYITGDALSERQVHVYVYSATGTLIQDEMIRVEEGSLTMDISKWERGVYIARIESGNNKLTARIIKY